MIGTLIDAIDVLDSIPRLIKAIKSHPKTMIVPLAALAAVLIATLAR